MQKIARMMVKEFAEYDAVKDTLPIKSVKSGDKFRNADGTIIYVTYTYRGDYSVTFLDAQGRYDGSQSIREYELLSHLNEHCYTPIEKLPDTTERIRF